jgi:hypothetical protein
MTADLTYDVPVYMRQGGTALVVASTGKVIVQTGGKIVPDSETQAAHIAHVTATGTTFVSGDKAKLNLVIDALTNVGILATG